MDKNPKELKLATYWQENMALYHHQPIKPLTPKEIGQIKTLFLKTGMLSKRLMDFAFKHWNQFTASTMASTGFNVCPEHPKIGYLLAHRDIAISLLIEMNVVSAEDAELALEAVKYLDEQESCK